MSPTSSFPFAQHLSIPHPRWDQAFAGRTRHQALPCIAGYRLERRVGEGRMSIAYLAQDLARGGRVVLKLLRREHCGSQARAACFAQEFAVPAALRNPHVIRVFDQVMNHECAYIAMEYLGGGHLGGLIRNGLTAAESLALLRQAALALDQLHRSGYAHRDVKPANLLLRYSGDLVLADFGLARRLDTADAAASAGQVVGTPCYASPELAQGAPAAAAADIYSLGVVFYEMLCGKPPFPGHTLMEVVCQHLMAPVPRLPQGLARYQALVDAMLEKKVESRLPHGPALLEQIDFLQGAGSLHRAPAGATGSRWQT